MFQSIQTTEAFEVIWNPRRGKMVTDTDTKKKEEIHEGYIQIKEKQRK